MIEKLNWYKNWFNSPFYPILYQNRDSRDARLLIDNLLQLLKPDIKASFLDLACGRGRHATYLADKGFDVTGLDMSINSIQEAKANEKENLHFLVGDMRDLPFSNHFHFVVNLFTSFGYFEESSDNLKTLASVHQALKDEGMVIIDFFNTFKVLRELIETEVKEVEGITFNITRTYVDGRIRKQIAFNHDDNEHYFEERVEALFMSDFEEMLETAGFKVMAQFGNYHLEPYIPESSERIIILGKKC